MAGAIITKFGLEDDPVNLPAGSIEAIFTIATGKLPTGPSVRDASQVDFDELGFDTTEKIQDLVDRALGWVYRYTGSQWIGGDFFGGPLGSDPKYIEPMAVDAVQSITELLAFRAQPEIAETTSDFDLIASFSAGSYNESRRLEGSRYTSGGPELLSAVQVLLWPLMDEDHQDEWRMLFGGINPPAFAVTEVDWGANGSYMGIGRSGRYLLGGLPQDPYPLPE